MMVILVINYINFFKNKIYILNIIMADENSNSMLTFVLVFMLGFFLSKLMPDICRTMNRSGLMDSVPNPSNGIIQGFSVGAHDCTGGNENITRNTQRFTVGSQQGSNTSNNTNNNTSRSSCSR